MGTGGARALPKHLCNKLGYDRLLQIVVQSEPLPDPKPNTFPRRIRGCKTSSCCASNISSRKKYQDIKNGLIPPDEHYDLEDAISKAGLP